MALIFVVWELRQRTGIGRCFLHQILPQLRHLLCLGPTLLFCQNPTFTIAAVSCCLG